jgi:hypothetical protein
MAIIGGYVARNMQNVAAIQTHAAQLGEGNANIAYELGRLHLVEPDQFVGRGCPTLLRARVLLSRLSTPTTGGGLGRRRNLSFLFFSLSL